METYALMTALRGVNPADYDGYDGKAGCSGCGNDMNLMFDIIKSIHPVRLTALQDQHATRENILGSLEKLVRSLKPGDNLIFTFAGHGAQVFTKDPNEPDGYNEILLSWNGYITDNELGAIWKLAPADSRILIVADCCHSETIIRPAPISKAAVRPLPTHVFKDIKCQIICMSASRDDQTAEGLENNGLFTATLWETWNHGSYEGSCVQLISDVREKIQDRQVPTATTYGVVKNDFLLCRAFHFPQS